MFGLTGAALAVLISKLINNIAKYWYVKKVFKLDPYNNSFLIVLGIGVLSYSLTFLIPDFTNIYIDSMIRTTIISLVYIYLSYITKVSPDLNQSLYQLKEIVIRFLKRRNKMDQ
jgi:Na+-driven multidrug efflux pump